MAGRFIAYTVFFKARAEIRKEKQIVKEIETFCKHPATLQGQGAERSVGAWDHTSARRRMEGKSLTVSLPEWEGHGLRKQRFFWREVSLAMILTINLTQARP